MHARSLGKAALFGNGAKKLESSEVQFFASMISPANSAGVPPKIQLMKVSKNALPSSHEPARSPCQRTKGSEGVVRRDAARQRSKEVRVFVVCLRIATKVAAVVVQQSGEVFSPSLLVVPIVNTWFDIL